MTRVANPDVRADEMERLAKRAALARMFGENDVAEELEAQVQAISDALDRAVVRETGVS